MIPPPPNGDILALLDLEQIDTHIFRNRYNWINVNNSLFGGQVLAQSLRAALLTVDRAPHSLHGYFLRPGSGKGHVVFTVENTRDGASFATRRVVAIQAGVPIFHMEASFHAHERGFAHSAPAELSKSALAQTVSTADFASKLGANAPSFARDRARENDIVERRLVAPERYLAGRCETPGDRMWMRLPSATTPSPDLQACALAYLSDHWVSAASGAVHGITPRSPAYMTASLDHAVWFHRPTRADEWLLYDIKSPWAGNGRGLALGHIYNANGELVATVAQEVLMRERTPAASNEPQAQRD